MTAVRPQGVDFSADGKFLRVMTCDVTCLVPFDPFLAVLPGGLGPPVTPTRVVARP